MQQQKKEEVLEAISKSAEKTEKEQKKAINLKLLYAVILVIILLSIGTLYYNQIEGWSYVDSVYFSTMTLTTVGYGDLVPTTDASKIFTSVYSVFGIGIMLYLLISVVSQYLLSKEKYFDNVISRMRKLSFSNKKGKK